MNSYSFATDNIIHKTLSNSVRAIYDPSNSLFDYIMNDIDIELYHDNNPYLLDYAYDLYISNNFLKHSMSRNNFLPSYHIHDIILVHEQLHHKFKKEDKVILNNNLKNTQKILLHSSLNDSWNNFDNKQNITYGIKDLDIDMNKPRDDILIINLKKNNQLTLVYQHLKNIFPKTSMITDIANNWETIYNTISSYKVIIDDNSIFHQLIGAYCGCIIITPNLHFDKNIIGYFDIENFGSVFGNMQSILSSYNSYKFIDQKQYITNNYSFNDFKDKISDTIKTIKRKTFIL